MREGLLLAGPRGQLVLRLLGRVLLRGHGRDKVHIREARLVRRRRRRLEGDQVSCRQILCRPGLFAVHICRRRLLRRRAWRDGTDTLRPGEVCRFIRSQCVPELPGRLLCG